VESDDRRSERPPRVFASHRRRTAFRTTFSPVIWVTEKFPEISAVSLLLAFREDPRPHVV